MTWHRKIGFSAPDGMQRDMQGTHQLISQKEDSLQAELAVAEVKEVFERGTEEIDDHGIVVALGPEPTDEGDTDTTSEGLVDL